VRTSLLALALPLAPLAIVGGGCTAGMHDASTVEQQQGACIALEGLRFESDAELECGLTPTGVHHCKWHIGFDTSNEAVSRFSWSHSDVGESGFVECNGNAVVTVQSSRELTGAFDPADQTLVWDGVTYSLIP
jgi:hypothetical protein